MQKLCLGKSFNILVVDIIQQVITDYVSNE